MKKIIIASFTFFIIIGTFAVVATHLGLQPTYVTKEYLLNTNISWYKLNVQGYFNNIRNTIDPNYLKNLLPQEPPTIKYTTTDALTFNVTIFIKGMAYVVDWLIYPINLFIILPIRIIFAYPVRLLLAVFGLDTMYLTQALNTMLTIEIPYIPLNW